MWWVAHFEVFGSPRTGFLVFAGGLACIGFLGFGWVFFGTREAEEVQQQAPMPFMPAFRETLGNGPFWVISIAFLLLMLGVQGFMTFSYYVNVYYVFGGDTAEAGKVMAALGAVGMAVEFLGLFVETKLGLWIGKRNAFIVCLAIFGLAPMSSWYLFTPEHPWLQLVMGLFISPCVVGLVMFPWAMIADVIDIDEFRTGRRREGAFSAVFTFLGKAATAIMVVLIGYILTWVGFQESVDEGTVQQSVETIRSLRLMFAFGPSAIVILAIPLMLLYPLNEKRVRELREVLDQRKHESNFEEE